MRILLVQNLTYIPARGGANKANKCLMEGLAALGHECRVIVPALTMHEAGFEGVWPAIERVGAKARAVSETMVEFELAGVSVSVISEPNPVSRLRLMQLRVQLAAMLTAFDPDIVLVASEDQGQVLLRVSLKHKARVVYIARSSSMLGIGPLCFFPNPDAPDLLRSVSLIVANSRYLAAYIHTWTGASAAVHDVPTYDPIRPCKAGAGEYVLMVNPCRVKGIDIFLEVAARLPGTLFAAVRGWGTTQDDLLRLRALRNVTILEPADNVGEYLNVASLLLVPSIWDEAFGRIVVEAMLCGVPVACSRVGGLPETALGQASLIPIGAVTRYTNRLDQKNIPIPVAPASDPDPWVQETVRLLRPETLAASGARSQMAASEYVGALSVRRIEASLLELTSK